MEQKGADEPWIGAFFLARLRKYERLVIFSIAMVIFSISAIAIDTYLCYLCQRGGAPKTPIGDEKWGQRVRRTPVYCRWGILSAFVYLDPRSGRRTLGAGATLLFARRSSLSSRRRPQWSSSQSHRCRQSSWSPLPGDGRELRAAPHLLSGRARLLDAQSQAKNEKRGIENPRPYEVAGEKSAIRPTWDRIAE